MASACVNNINMSPENFPPAKYSPYGWLSPRVSLSREVFNDDPKAPPPPSAAGEKKNKKKTIVTKLPELPEPEPTASGDFEFRLHDTVTMLPADELFSDGKLVPLQLNNVKPIVNELIPSEMGFAQRRTEISGAGDPYLFSPKAPRCSSRWRELLGFKKATKSKIESATKTTSPSASQNTNTKSFKQFLHRNSKSSYSSSSSLSSSSSSLDGASLSLPLLKETSSFSDCECVSISSSRLSLSSSSSSHEHEDLPRLSLDSDKLPNPNPFVKNPHPRVRLVRARAGDSNLSGRGGRSPMRRAEVPVRGVSVDSPRLNSSGKIVFESLERSSSSPSSFNGGIRYKHRGMERSYSANVRVTPVLNVPVCSLRGGSKPFGFGQFFSSQQKNNGSNAATAYSAGKANNNKRG